MNRKQRLAELWARIDDAGELDVVDQLFAPEYIRHSGRGEQSRAEFKQLLSALRAGFPDIQSRIVDAVEEGDKVAYRWVSTGTHLGTYLGAPPTGRSVTASGVTISRFRGELVVEDWASWNEVSVLHSLGILPIDR